jgi:hypothetical protein
MKIKLTSIAIILFFLVIFFLDANRRAPAQTHILTVTAEHVDRAPETPEDSIWDNARSVPIPVQGHKDPSRRRESVWTRVLYTNADIYFLFKWHDPTRSITKQAWQFDGKKWRHLEGNEDRLALLFEITRIDKFATRGCAITCHSPPDLPREEWKFATRTAAEKGDLWHWQAARSDPYGYADDAWLTVAGNPSGSYRETGRRKDSGRGGDVKNQTQDESAPLYTFNPERSSRAPGFLFFEEAIPIKDSLDFKPGDRIPYRLPVNPSGSRADVAAVSRYSDSGWTLMLHRKMNTGHDDDIAFDPHKRYSFAMAVFDDSGSDHSKATKALILEFNR